MVSNVRAVDGITYLETFCKMDIVTFATLSQPSMVVGNLGGIGRGWPNTIQNRSENAARAPVIAPVSVADSVPMPSVKMPNSGPPTTPKIVREACDERNLIYRRPSRVKVIMSVTWSSPPRNCAINASAMQTRPNVKASTLATEADFVGVNSYPMHFRYMGFT